ncbi:hypothetical protein PMAYCL1PPCAC_02469, partial [Pristionchus mayeri]
VHGVRTMAHCEDGCLPSINLCIGEGSSEWFGIPHDYIYAFEELCKEKGVDYLKENVWPDAGEIMEKGIPLYRFDQKKGDFVFTAPGTLHWVQAKG